MAFKKAVSRYKSILGIAIAAVILTAIFIPFQKADAFTITTTLPNASGNTTTQSTAGETFNVSITIAAGELISLSSIDTIIDNGQSSVARTTFTVSGSTASYSSGTRGIIKDNTLSLTLPSVSANGYGYGYGAVSNGITGPTGYSYAIPYSNALIGGNNYGYSYAIGSAVTGFVGPGTIVISGTLNTSLMSAGSHTLDVVINTGVGANPANLVAPQLTFTVNANTQVVTTTVSSGTTVTPAPVTVPGVGTVTITLSNVASGGTIAVEPKSAAVLDAVTPSIFSAIGTVNIFNVGSSTANTVGTVFEVDASSIVLGSGGFIDVTIPYNEALLPTGFNEANVKFFHWTGSAWQDKTHSVNTSANTVTGRLTSLSPVVAGFLPSSSSSSSSTTTTTSGGSGGGGGGGGGGAPVDLTPTYADPYFLTNPLAKVQLQNSALVNAKGLNIFQAKQGEQISIDTTFKNYQQKEQKYAIIVQVIDSRGFTADIGWVAGTLAAGETTQAARSWVALEPGTYTIKMFVWDGISKAPTPLSEVTVRSLTVT